MQDNNIYPVSVITWRWENLQNTVIEDISSILHSKETEYMSSVFGIAFKYVTTQNNTLYAVLNSLGTKQGNQPNMIL